MSKLANAALRIQLTADATPTIPGVSGTVPLGIRHVRDWSQADQYLWGLAISNITAANAPVVNFATGLVTADGTAVTGNPGVDFEGKPLAPVSFDVLVIEVTGALVTATASGPGLLARLPIGTHVFSAAHLSEWFAGVTFAAPAGTAALSFSAHALP